MKKIKVLFLSNNVNSKDLFERLKEDNEIDIVYGENELSIDYINSIKPELIISYNYKYLINKEIIDYMDGNIINLHISYLPWNKGSDPNFWSFIDETPKGVTIHRLEPGLDSGKIIYQKEIVLNPENESFESSYIKLNNEIVELFLSNWENIKFKRYNLRNQMGQGTYHRHKELEEVKKHVPFNWDDNIAEYIERYHKYCDDSKRSM